MIFLAVLLSLDLSYGVFKLIYSLFSYISVYLSQGLGITCLTDHNSEAV